MKKILRILLIIASLFVIGLIIIGVNIYSYLSIKPINQSSVYFKNYLGNIYYDSTTGCLDICLFRSYSKLPNADKKTFQVLNVDSPYNFGERLIESGYAKDKSNVYYMDNIITEADPLSFSAVNPDLGKDNKQYYLYEYPLIDYIYNEIDTSISLAPQEINIIGYFPSDHLVIKDKSKYYFVKLNPQPKAIWEITEQEAMKIQNSSLYHIWESIPQNKTK